MLQYSHSLTYFIFLSVKLGLFDEDLFRFVINEIYVERIEMELESVVNLLFTFSRIEKLIGMKDFVRILDGQ